MFFKEYLTCRYAWLKLSLNDFCDFLQEIFLKLDDSGRQIENDHFATIRTFTISLVNILPFG